MAQNSDAEFSAQTRQAFWSFLKLNSHKQIPVVVIGGGIVGAGTLRELSLRGVKDVLLLEKGDFASGTSGASSKLIHAGLRYLEQVWTHLLSGRITAAWLNFRFVVAASYERKVLGLLAPGLIKPKRIYLVLGKRDRRSSVEVALGVWLYWFIQLVQGQLFPAPRLRILPSSIHRVCPELNLREVKCVIDFWDSETDDARLVIENVRSAVSMGAMALNYVELISFKQCSDFVSLTVVDHESGETLTLKATVMINATGPWLDHTRGLSLEKNNADIWIDKVAGSHIDVYPAITDKSFYITASDGRLVFVLARNEDGLVYNRIGTTEKALADSHSPDDVSASADEVKYLCESVNAFMNVGIDVSERIVHVDAGVRPLRKQKNNHPFEKSREHDVIVEGRIAHVVGVKLTDYRRVSSEMMRNLPWKSWGVLLKRKQSKKIPLRSSNQALYYLEKTDDELKRRTMVVRSEDLVHRRRGLSPLIHRGQ